MQQNPVLRSWAAHFKLTETKRALEEIDGWLRRKLRCRLWLQWKQPYTRAKYLMKAGLKLFFDRLGRVSLLDTTRRLQCLS